jgi:hypothetical protein
MDLHVMEAEKSALCKLETPDSWWGGSQSKPKGLSTTVQSKSRREGMSCSNREQVRPLSLCFYSGPQGTAGCLSTLVGLLIQMLTFT